MLSRIFWVGIAGIALVTGMIIQDGDQIFSWGDRHDASVKAERAIEASVERAVEGSVARMEVVGADGKAIDVAPQDKRALADAIGRLVEAETALAFLKIRDVADGERQAAQIRRDQARAEVETLKSEIQRQRDAVRADGTEVRDQVRDEIRESIREAVRN